MVQALEGDGQIDRVLQFRLDDEVRPGAGVLRLDHHRSFDDDAKLPLAPEQPAEILLPLLYVLTPFGLATLTVRTFWLRCPPPREPMPMPPPAIHPPTVENLLDGEVMSLSPDLLSSWSMSPQRAPQGP